MSMCRAGVQPSRVTIVHLAFLSLSLLLVGACACAGSNPVTAFQWLEASPESQGMDGAGLEAMRDSLAERRTTGLLVVRNDRIVYEWYQKGHGPKEKHYTASMAKAIVGGVSLAVAISDGLVTLDDPAAEFVPEWKDDPRKSKITIRQLGSHTSGIEDAEADGLPHEKLTGWKGDFWKRLDPPRDPFTLARDKAPAVFEPGKRLGYSNPGIAMLSYCITASLRNAPERDLRTLLRERIMRPMDVADADWSVGYGKTYTVDGLPLVAPWGGGNYTARAVASVGRLMLHEGNWQGKQLIRREAVRRVTRDASTPGNCGIGWWSNNDGSSPELPKDAFWGSGAGHQIVLVVPSLNLIAVRNGEALETTAGEPNDYHRPLRRYLFAPLVASVKQSSPPAERSAGKSTSITPLVRTVDLDIDEAQEIELADGTTAHIKLLDVQDTRDRLRNAVREARVKVEVNGTLLTLVSATYHLPVTVAGVQVDCPITSGYIADSSKQNAWSLKKAARLRLWPAGSPWMRPGTFGYPVRQRWFAGDTQMANEPTFVNGDERPARTDIYYHYGLDFGGAEGLVEVVAATDGLVVSAAGETLPEYVNSPAKARYDVIYILDGRGWYCRYSHLMTTDVTPGQRVRMGERIGLLGKEGGSGGWSHLHFDITSRQPSGQWGIQDAYAFAWQAYQQESHPKILAVARPHHLAALGEKVTLDGTKSWSSAGKISRYEWQFTDGSTASGATVERVYTQPGMYSEVLKVTDVAGRVAWDFPVVQALDPTRPEQLPPTIHAACYPTTDIRPGDPVTFKVRTFRTTSGDECWDFGDGGPPVHVQSDGNANVHAEDGYAVAEHRYDRPGHYLVRVERSNERGEKAVDHLVVEVQEPVMPHTRVSIRKGRWFLNDEMTYLGAKAEGLLMNVRMVNAVFEDRRRCDLDPDGNTDEFIARIPEYVNQGVRAFTLCLQGGMPGYEGAINTAFNPDGSLRDSYLQRVRRVIEACDRNGAAVILGCYYQRQDQVLRDEEAVRVGVINVVKWIERHGFTNVVLEIANEFGHGGFDHRLLKTAEGITELIHLAKETCPALLVSASGLGNGRLPDTVAQASDFLLIHFNGTRLEDIPACISALKRYNKPIVCNEDEKVGEQGAKAAELCVANGASWGFMQVEVNQHFPFIFQGAADDPQVYRAVERLTATETTYFPPPESQGGWRKLDRPEDIREIGGMDPAKLDDLKQWLLQSDKRNFAADVIRRGWVVLEVERGNSAKTDSRRVASVSKAVCATVLAIASEQSQQGLTPRKMKFGDPAFDFIPWAQPLSDPRKARITVRQLLNHTSGLCPEATGASNDGTWEYILGHTGDPRTAKLAFDPGTACGYSTHALHHASLVCETVTGKPYDQFAIEALFKPLGIERWWFQYFDGGEGIGRHPTHGLGMPARDLARIAYCMLHNGRWSSRQVIPTWFVEHTGAPSHDVHSPEMRWKLNPQTFTLGWELPSRLTGEDGRSGQGIPADARDKPGSGGQFIAFVPSLDLVITRQTGSSGDWEFEEYLRRACAAVTPDSKEDEK